MDFGLYWQPSIVFLRWRIGLKFIHSFTQNAAIRDESTTSQCLASLTGCKTRQRR